MSTGSCTSERAPVAACWARAGAASSSPPCAASSAATTAPIAAAPSRAVRQSNVAVMASAYAGAAAKPR